MVGGFRLRSKFHVPAVSGGTRPLDLKISKIETLYYELRITCY